MSSLVVFISWSIYVRHLSDQSRKNAKTKPNLLVTTEISNVYLAQARAFLSGLRIKSNHNQVSKKIVCTDSVKLYNCGVIFFSFFPARSPCYRVCAYLVQYSALSRLWRHQYLKDLCRRTTLSANMPENLVLGLLRRSDLNLHSGRSSWLQLVQMVNTHNIHSS